MFVNKSCWKAWSAGKLSRRVWSACVTYEYRYLLFVNKSCWKVWSTGELSRKVWSAGVMYEYRVQSPVNKSINRTLSYSICSRLLLKCAWFFPRFFLKIKSYIERFRFAIQWIQLLQLRCSMSDSYQNKGEKYLQNITIWKWDFFETFWNTVLLTFL